MKKLNEIIDKMDKSWLGRSLDSPIEEKMLVALRRYKVEAVPQYRLKGVKIDIGLPEYQVGIECDGKEWHKDKLRDQARDIACEKQGWKIHRYTGSEIFRFSKMIAERLAIEYGFCETLELVQCQTCGGCGEECICKD